VHIDFGGVHVGKPALDVVAAARKRPVGHAGDLAYRVVGIERRHLEPEARDFFLQEPNGIVVEDVGVGVDCPHALSPNGGLFDFRDGYTMSFTEAKSRAWLLAIAGIGLAICAQPTMAEVNAKTCTTGTITLGPFSDHIAQLRKMKRYEPEQIDKLIADEKAGGPEFFSSQVVIKEEQSGSGDFDLNMFQGFSDPKAKYRPQVKWACGA
jgi:hypothetical protein